MPENDFNNPAEELFKRYSGSFFAMDRAGCIDEYKKFNVSDSTEKLWFSQLEEEWRKALCCAEGEQIKLQFSRLCLLSQNSRSESLLAFLSDFLSRIPDKIRVNDKLSVIENFIETLRNFSFRGFDIEKFREPVYAALSSVETAAFSCGLERKYRFIENTFKDVYRR